MHELMINYILYFIIPLWLVAGIADWNCHRISHIEKNAGTKESLMHFAMLIEAGVALLAGLLLEINAGIIIFMILIFFLHQATALWDVTYAQSKRYLSPLEQHIHSFLEMMPLIILILISLIHWSQFENSIRGDLSAADFNLQWKVQPLPLPYIAVLLVAILGLQIIPYVEEFIRCQRYAVLQRH